MRSLFLLVLLTGAITTGAATAQVSGLRVIEPVVIEDYLPNPGIGWQHVPGIGEQLLPETVIYPNRVSISWKLLNPADDVYAWDALDTKISQAIFTGKQIGFRVYTMRGEGPDQHQVPDWVFPKGAVLLTDGQPDYSNCVYQQEWGEFVDALRLRYDGNPAIAFIDISGYGEYNEWGWDDEFTEWDDQWNDQYARGRGSASDFVTIDGQTRRRLVDTFIGGSFEQHQCFGQNDLLQTVAYNYTGFQETQLVMPWAGIRQSSQYVFRRRADVGFRFDCLGDKDISAGVLPDLGVEIGVIWRTAPIIYELCATDFVDPPYVIEANNLLRATHGSLVHDNIEDEAQRERLGAENLLRYAGYRYTLTRVTYPEQVELGSTFVVEMHWHNVGYAPSYPKMWQIFQPRLYFVSFVDVVEAEFSFNVDVSTWMPAENWPTAPPDNAFAQTFQLPPNLTAGRYRVMVAMVNLTTGRPINLALEGNDGTGRYALDVIDLVEPVGQPSS